MAVDTSKSGHSSKQFHVGDIVEHVSGRICNGRYGEIIEFQGELTVLDNEGALDMPVPGNEHELTVVGNVRDNADLLKIFVNGALEG
jgi:hypothetical protein